VYLDDKGTIHSVLGVLYLRGLTRPLDPPRSRWPLVCRALREADPNLGQAARVLREAQLWEEALVLDSPGVLAWGVDHAGEFLTPVCPFYPVNWRRRLGRSAPPAVWQRVDGGFHPPAGLIGVVGRRQPSSEEGDFAFAVAEEAHRLDYGLVSGGAEGCDRSAYRGIAQFEDSRIVTLHPCGLRHAPSLFGVSLSVCAPGEPFSTAGAMERNGLIYSAAEATVVAAAQFRAGGSWHGAVDALRRRLGPVFVRPDGSPAMRALASLGARPLEQPDDLGRKLADLEASEGAQPALFALG